MLTPNLSTYLLVEMENSENEKTANSNFIDQKITPHTDDRVCSDVSLPNRNSLDSGRSQMPTIDPFKHVGGQLLTPNEANVRSAFIE